MTSDPEEFPESFDTDTEDFSGAEKQTEDLGGDFSTTPSEENPLDKPPLETGVKITERRDDLLSAPQGKDMHRFSGGMLMLLMMAFLLGIGIYVIYSLFQAFDGYLMDENTSLEILERMLKIV